MGLIVEEPEGSEVHGEARRESFAIFTDFGEDYIELLWSQLPHLKKILENLERYHKEKP